MKVDNIFVQAHLLQTTFNKIFIHHILYISKSSLIVDINEFITTPLTTYRIFQKCVEIANLVVGMKPCDYFLTNQFIAHL